MLYRLIQTRVANRPGVLNRITQVILRPRYNIDTLTLTGTDDPGVSIITVGIRFEDLEAARLLTKQLEKQVDVIYALDITEGVQV
ncbi:acetolactate synthase small subunit [Aerococcus urinaehominis]|uniref:acetolactate synthase n=1 Tax=Aerococcus urinaehominis TaxID=128944 RepID=A0A0X8FLV3_9LACT|nr:ACT domain-containing protein [Aerococcus urinaehominis]AMB99022.1 acetolactate synthase small subunit [Aerococcus urinaehominis]SDM56355.1 acetolactate synthase, small subunit [Aerococcus urinaehominis]